MLKRPLKVFFVSAEVAPFSSVGGLSQVSYFLPRALLKLGVDVRIFTPKYGVVNEEKFPLKRVCEGMMVPTGEIGETDRPEKLVCNVKMFGEEKKSEPTVYFLENQEYFELRANVYGYSDDHIRFGLLSRGALEFVKQGYFEPDIIHANDWHTGYLINYLEEEARKSGDLEKIATVLSVHNLFQGNFDFEHASDMDFDDGKSLLAPFLSDQFVKQNPLKRGIMYADLVNTVSETYAREIMTEEYGRNLASLFKEVQEKMFGVLNGLDNVDFNPATDKIIKNNYTSKSIKVRAENKIDLQKQFNLDVDPDKPMLAFWGRMDWQKGIDLIMSSIEFVLNEFDAQVIMMGKPGDDNYRQFFTDLEAKYPGKVGVHLMANFALPRKIASGADFFMAPSRYEPGGIVVVEAMRYGCVPIVRATGGLADAVENFDPQKDTGYGFTFKKYAPEGFLVAVVRALEAYKNRAQWQRIVRRAMEKDFSWSYSAKKYLDLYYRAIDFHRESRLPNPPRAFKKK
jgi:starch synthase